MKSQIQKEIEVLQQLSLLLRQGEADKWKYIEQNMPKLVNILNDLLTCAFRLVDSGINLPVEIVLKQIQNLNESYENKDMVMLADTLEYEIINALYLYIELIESGAV